MVKEGHPGTFFGAIKNSGNRSESGRIMLPNLYMEDENVT
jgi:hypothetical protein